MHSHRFNYIEKVDFIEGFSKLADYVFNKEPRTLSYELAQSDKEEKRLLVIERYVNKQAYTDIHRRSPDFISFRENLNKMDVSIEGHSYIETNI